MPVRSASSLMWYVYMDIIIFYFFVYYNIHVLKNITKYIINKQRNKYNIYNKNKSSRLIFIVYIVYYINRIAVDIYISAVRVGISGY